MLHFILISEVMSWQLGCGKLSIAGQVELHYVKTLSSNIGPAPMNS